MFQKLGRLVVVLLCAWADTDPASPFADKIFNEQDLSGWVIEGTKEYQDAGETKPNWFVEDGAIHCAGHGFGFLRFDRKLSDFRLSLEYRLAAKGNSGIGIRSVPFTGPAKTRPSFAGYELQLLEDQGKPPTTKSTMSLYRYVAPTASAARPAGEWNEVEIECHGPIIRVRLNGQQVQDVDQSTVEEIKAKPLVGFVSLQCHGSRVEFRNLTLETIGLRP